MNNSNQKQTNLNASDVKSVVSTYFGTCSTKGTIAIFNINQTTGHISSRGVQTANPNEVFKTPTGLSDLIEQYGTTKFIAVGKTGLTQIGKTSIKNATKLGIRYALVNRTNDKVTVKPVNMSRRNITNVHQVRNLACARS
jgi:hypothetical protein